jgi:predicted enzyme related to lactoylglutathione lyase
MIDRRHSNICSRRRANVAEPVGGGRLAAIPILGQIGQMKITSVTIGMPVRDFAIAADWYQSVFELDGPDLRPADGVIEFKLGPIWLQLAETREHPASESVIRFGVDNVGAERDRLRNLGISTGALEHVENAVDYVDFRDPDGNNLSFYSMS